MGSSRRVLEKVTKGIKSLKKLLSTEGEYSAQGPFLQKWNKIIYFTCVFASSLDALFFYIPVMDGKKKCLNLDNKLEITVSILRLCTDIFYLLHIFFQFCTKSTRVFGWRRVYEDQDAMVKRYLLSYFVIDILAILPLPQVVILVIITNPRGSFALNIKDILKFIVFFQCVPRLIRLYPLYKKATSRSGVLTETAWAGAAFNLFLYMIASHVIGALWYLFTIEQEDACWRIACNNHKCNGHYLYCGDDRAGDYSFLNVSCPLLQPNEIKDITDFDFGIFLDALQSHVVEMRDFRRRFFYCFWWGLRSLSSLGQNLRTSTFVGEILFAVFISIIGLVLFALLIGNMQKYLQSLTNRIEQMRVKREDAERWEQWMSKRMLPQDLRVRIRRHEEYKWQETRGVEEESLLCKLPKDIRRDIKRHLCLHLLGRVPMFEKMDEQLLDEMCDRLKQVHHTESSYIMREGDQLEGMFFIVQGILESVSTDGGRIGFFNRLILRAGDFCGEELVTWALDPRSSSLLPQSTRTVKTLTGVEASTLAADDLKFLASQFRRFHSKQLQPTFRFYSRQWRTWAACFIQVSWRRYCRRKLLEEEARLHDFVDDGTQISTSLGATIYASMFVTKALHRNRALRAESFSPLLIIKPTEPDFSA